jgi:hypothetical protein
MSAENVACPGIRLPDRPYNKQVAIRTELSRPAANISGIGIKIEVVSGVRGKKYN